MAFVRVSDLSDEHQVPVYNEIEDNEFRLLYLEPGEEIDEICCKIRRWPYGISPKYEALSYEWGIKEGKQISLDGHQVNINKNLSDALLALRLRYKRRIIWVDALCINQNNHTERNEQVAKMGQIYQDADRVVSWIG
ncbi:uncharacterized protein K452DRAFT_226405, partial [Aplosporella prunicola CBS 121167]